MYELIIISVVVILCPEFYLEFKKIETFFGMFLIVCIVAMSFNNINNLLKINPMFNIGITFVYIMVVLTLNVKVTNYYIKKAKIKRLPNWLQINFQKIKFKE